MKLKNAPIQAKEEHPPHYESIIKTASWNDWAWQLENAIKDIPGASRETKSVLKTYPVFITPYYFSLIDKNNPNDPLAKQCLPSHEELKDKKVDEDPLRENKFMPVPWLVHRYPDRVLVNSSNMCAMNCRHCTRKREWSKGRVVRSLSEIDRMAYYVSGRKQIKDVVISGGDPLLYSTDRLEYIIKKFRDIEHVEIIRIGTRVPVVLPQRIDKALVSMLKKYRPIWLNTQFNHPNEITIDSRRACDQIITSGIPVNNQSVLLKGVNDNVKTMTDLYRSLLTIGIRPYYLYQCDMVKGATHFRTSINKGLEIIKAMRGRVSGLAIPKFVVDLPNGGGKIPLEPKYLVARSKKHILFRNFEDKIIKYKDVGPK